MKTTRRELIKTIAKIGGTGVVAALSARLGLNLLRERKAKLFSKQIKKLEQEKIDIRKNLNNKNLRIISIYSSEIREGINENKLPELERLINEIKQKENNREFKMQLNSKKFILSTAKIVSETLNIDPALILALIQTESKFKSFKKGNKGELGLMQVKPSTANYVFEQQLQEKMLGKEIIENFNNEMLFNPVYNILIGSLYLKMLYFNKELNDSIKETNQIDASFKRIEKTIKAYNAGLQGSLRNNKAGYKHFLKVSRNYYNAELMLEKN